MVQEQKGRFKLAMANANMPDMDSLELLHALLDKDIPVILISSETSVFAARKAIAEGASFILHEPISIDDLRYVWQHAYRNRRNAADQTQNETCQEKENGSNISQYPVIQETTENACKEDEVEGNAKETYALIEKDCSKTLENTITEHSMTDSNEKQGVEKIKRRNEVRHEEQREKRVKIIFEEENHKWKKTIIEEEIEEKSSSDRRSRVLWTPELHLKFTAAISALGDKKARPKPILEMMNVPHLTQRQVASHLQKYKSQVRRICETGTTSLPAVCRSSNFAGRTRVLDAADKNTSAAVCEQGSQSSDFGIRDILRMSESFYRFRTPNIISSNSSQSKSQVPVTSSSTTIQELLDCLAGKGTSGNVPTPCAAKLPTNFINEENPKLDIMEASVPISGNESCADKFRKDLIDVDRGTDSMEISNTNSVNVPDTYMSTAGFANEELDALTYLSLNDQGLPNLDKDLTGFGDLNQELDPMEVLSPTSRNVSNDTAVSALPANQSQIQSKYADIWNMLEEEPDGSFNDLEGEANPEDIDRYCQWLTNVMLGNS
ncbi:hypothetical protein RCOM_0577360 [Ricinus communis]|uniref:Uncharacterized protein n=1 Tax=Ricinus communis TaxID=3988 RepID=B9SJX5_RICCO|nr:hypothetical protein RCOM_0577360 [Ricinus communis]